jgi:transcriptional regulator with XRE-family HTH domain
MPENLWEIRRRKKMTVTQLAGKSGVSARLIKEYESGQRPIRTGDLPRLARALFVDPAELKTACDPIPPEAPPRPGPAPKTVERKAVSPRKEKKKPPSPAAPPPRPTQITHLQKLGERFSLTEQDFEAQLGKPLAEASRGEVSALLGELQRRATEERKVTELGKRRRPYLPESVDEFEFHYLTRLQEGGRRVDFTLFDGQTLSGKIVGFSPYAITIREEDGPEVVIQKLAIAFYRIEGGQ